MMKKYFVTLFALFVAIVVDAQDTWKPPTPTKSQTFRMGAASINRQGYIYTIAAKTDKAMDESQMVLYLGNGREEALKSINILLEYTEMPSGNSLIFNDATLQVWGNHIRIVNIKDKFYWGEALISDAEVKKMKKFIEKGK